MNSHTIQAFSGTLELLGVAEALQVVSSMRKTGVLHIRPSIPELECKIALRDGQVVSVDGPSVPHTADVLLKFGVAPHTVGRLWTALAEGKDPQVLQAVGHKTFEAVLRWRLEFGLLPLWGQRTGSFEFMAQHIPNNLVHSIALEPSLLELARRVDECSRLPKVPLGACYNIAERVGNFSSVLKTLMNADWALLNALDGETPLLMVSVAILIPIDELQQRLLYLERVGLIELAAAQRGIKRKYPRLVRGDFAPNFTLPALDGSSFSLGSLRGRRTLLTFFRHAGCPFCNMRVHQLIKAYPRLQRLGIEVVGVFGSDLEGLRRRVGQQRPPFVLLADADDSIHTLYGTNRSLLGLLASFAPPGLGSYLEGLHLGIEHGSTDGQATRMPADFLLSSELQIEFAHYGNTAADHIELEQLGNRNTTPHIWEDQIEKVR
ncbi:MAG: redoxin domain-containing protein [Deinococcales bacterium]